jgi:hypothetical protein
MTEPTKSFAVRDVPAQTIELIDLRAQQAGMSREAYVKWLLEQISRYDHDAQAIRLNPPLPCGVLKHGTQECGNPAPVAMLWRGPVPGQWIALPQCQDCVERAARLYQAMKRADELTDYGRNDPAERRTTDG